VLEPTERARSREELLESVFSAFAQLWDEALGVRIMCDQPACVACGMVLTRVFECCI
jgi:hypothetical protein